MGLNRDMQLAKASMKSSSSLMFIVKGSNKGCNFLCAKNLTPSGKGRRKIESEYNSKLCKNEGEIEGEEKKERERERGRAKKREVERKRDRERGRYKMGGR
jgi:hypothetical protein